MTPLMDRLATCLFLAKSQAECLLFAFALTFYCYILLKANTQNNTKSIAWKKCTQMTLTPSVRRYSGVWINALFTLRARSGVLPLIHSPVGHKMAHV